MPKNHIFQSMLSALDEAQKRINQPEHEREQAISNYLPTFENVIQNAWNAINKFPKSGTYTSWIDLIIEMLTNKADMHLILAAFKEQKGHYEEALTQCDASSVCLTKAHKCLIKTRGLLNKKIHQQNIYLIKNNYHAHLTNIFTQSLTNEINQPEAIQLEVLGIFIEKYKKIISENEKNSSKKQEAVGDFFYDAYEHFANADINIGLEGYINLLDAAEKGYAEALKLLPHTPNADTPRQNLYQSIFNIHFYKHQCYLEHNKTAELRAHVRVSLKYIHETTSMHIFDEIERQSYKDYVLIYDKHLKNIEEAKSSTTEIETITASTPLHNDHTPQDQLLEQLLLFGKEQILGYGAGQNDIAKVALILARIFRNADNLLGTLFDVDANFLNQSKQRQFKLLYSSYDLYIKAAKIVTDDILKDEIQRCLDFIWESHGQGTFKEMLKSDFQLPRKQNANLLNTNECQEEMAALINFAINRLREILGKSALENRAGNICKHIFEQHKPYRDATRNKRFKQMNAMANLEDPFCLELVKPYLPSFEKDISVTNSFSTYNSKADHETIGIKLKKK